MMPITAACHLMSSYAQLEIFMQSHLVLFFFAVGLVANVPAQRIAFTSERDGNAEIYIMNADGSGQTRLTTRPATSDRYPAISPDGRSIAFVSSVTGGIGQIYIMDIDGK